ncbi:MAG: hypothetical protein ACRDHP_17245, partial [Ktedonobacterales bacterium]
MARPGFLVRGTRARWIFARTLACLGALLFVAAGWLPWADVTIAFTNGGFGEAYTEALPGLLVPVLLPARLVSRLGARQAHALDGWLGIVWEALLFSGILLALALWQRSSARLALWMKRIVRAWLIALTLLTLLGAWTLLNVTEWFGVNDGVRVVRSGLDIGLWLALAALALFWTSAY